MSGDRTTVVFISPPFGGLGIGLLYHGYCRDAWTGHFVGSAIPRPWFVLTANLATMDKVRPFPAVLSPPPIPTANATSSALSSTRHHGGPDQPIGNQGFFPVIRSSPEKGPLPGRESADSREGRKFICNPTGSRAEVARAFPISRFFRLWRPGLLAILRIHSLAGISHFISSDAWHLRIFHYLHTHYISFRVGPKHPVQGCRAATGR